MTAEIGAPLDLAAKDRGGLALQLGGGLFVGLAGVLVAIEAGWWAGVPLSAFPLAVLPLALIVQLALADPHLRRPLAFGHALVLAATLAACFGASHLRDYSVDGPGYHAPAVVRMLAGWNPLRGETGLLWVDAYPHGLWALKASIAILFGGSVEAGRGIGVLLVAATGLVAAAGLSQLAGRVRLAAVVLIVVSPISAGQFLTDYVDWPLGLMASALVFALAGLDGRYPRLTLLAAVAIALLMAATKSSGVYFLFVASFAACLPQMLARRGRPQALFGRLGLYAAYTGAVIVLAVFCCYRPYLTNILDHGAFDYPGFDTVLGRQIPANLVGAGPVLRFFFLLVSGPGAGLGEPLTVGLLPAGAAQWGPDNRGAGFGDLFYLQALLALLLGLWAGAMRRGGTYLWFAACFALAGLFFPVNWWARLVPVVWTASVLAAVAIFGPPHTGQRKAGAARPGRGAALLFGLFLLVALHNILLFAVAGLGYARVEQARFADLVAALRPYPRVLLQGSATAFFDVSYGQALARAGVTAESGDCRGLQEVQRLYGGELVICAPP